jgi:eukaryotic-like serine/threonine-protein kinase
MSDTIAGGRYRLERPLGHGGMASVYLARDTELDRPVALKLLAESLGSDESVQQRFVREARLAARLSHPNVVSVFDAGDDGGRPYIVMEYVDGQNLAELLARRGSIPPDEARGLALQAAQGLAHAHAAGLVHRDVKPQNLILRGDGTLKIADFGIARAAEATALTQTGTVLGTAAYLSPEQALGEEVTPATDVYSLGAVLYELLTGRPPFLVETLDDLAQRPAMEVAPVRELVPAAPRDLEDVVMHCLARNPEYRPCDGAELARELRSGQTGTTKPLPAPSRREWFRDRRLIWAAVAGLLLLAAALLAVVLASGGSSKPSGGTAVTVEQPKVQPIPRGTDAQEQARNIAAWLRQHSGG